MYRAIYLTDKGSEFKVQGCLSCVDLAHRLSRRTYGGIMYG
jgi:hypothetical protein